MASNNNVLDKNVGEFSILDSFFIVGSKLGTSETSKRIEVIGDGTYKSGLIKTGGALLGSYFTKNKYAKYALSGVLIDGMEDILLNLKGMAGGLSNQQENNGEIGL
jgi:hypothetical protein